MKPTNRITLDKFYQLHGQHYKGNQWSKYAIHFLNYANPDLTDLNIPDEDRQWIENNKGLLHEMAVENAKACESHLREHLNLVFFSDNGRTFYEYDGHTDMYDYINSTCENSDNKTHYCKITLKSSSALVNSVKVDLFDPDIANDALGKYKQILISEAILKYLTYYGPPENQEELFRILKEDFHTKYPQNVKFNDNVSRENIRRMLSAWYEIKK
jgi:hypothetical protein